MGSGGRVRNVRRWRRRRWWGEKRPIGSHLSASRERGAGRKHQEPARARVGYSIVVSRALLWPMGGLWASQPKPPSVPWRRPQSSLGSCKARLQKLAHAKPWAHTGHARETGSLLLPLTVRFPLLLLSSTVPIRTLLLRDDQPCLSEGTARDSEKLSQVPRPPSKMAESQLGILALLAPGHSQPLSPRPMVPAGLLQGVLNQEQSRAPSPVRFPQGEMEARTGTVAVPRPHSPRRTTYGVNM